MTTDNQNRNLDAVKRHHEVLARGTAVSNANAAAHFAASATADWTEVKGVEVLRAGDSNYVAVPCSGRRSSARFDIIDIEANELVAQVAKNEVREWLYRVSN